jgi:hypothetical protein
MRMDRRRFLLTSLASAVAMPVGTEAQPRGRVYRIGYVGVVPSTEGGRTFDATRTCESRIRRMRGHADSVVAIPRRAMTQQMAQRFRSGPHAC